MTNPKHPDREKIKQYIWQVLEETEEIAIGEHLADCRECAAIARKEAQDQYLWENWQAENHGRLYWQEQVRDVLNKSYTGATSYYRKERLKRWLEEWKGKLGSMLQFINSQGKKIGKVITDFPGELFLPQADFRFTPAPPVRGSDPETAHLHLTAGREQNIRIKINRETGDVHVQLPREDYEPPLLILLPRKGPSQVILAAEAPGTNYYCATFKLSPEEEFCLLFEPLPGC